MIAIGRSVLGLSEVMTAKSEYLTPISPIIGRFRGSRSPPQPNTAITRPLQKS